MKPKEPPEFEVVRGIVAPTAWSATGEPRLVAILTPNEGEYDVVPIAAGVDLLSHLREEIEARTVVKTDHRGRQSIKVVSFAVVGAIGQDRDKGSGDNAVGSERGLFDRPGG